MLLWASIAILSAAVVVYVLRPLVSDKTETRNARDADVAIYNDQIAEIEANAERGLIDAAEAESARAEVARRLLRRASQEDAGAEAAAQRAGPQLNYRPIVLASYIALPMVAFAFYMSVGAPHLPQIPHASRLAKSPGDASVNELVAMVEARLRKNPDEGKGWDAIAPIYLRMGRFPDAANAYHKAIGLLGENKSRLAGFAEASIKASGGMVTESVRKAYERLLAIDPENFDARIWLAYAKEQDGDANKAADDYVKILAEAPKNAPWINSVRKRLAALRPGAAKADKTKPSVAAPKLDGDTLAAAKNMTQEQRADLIEQMVNRLAARLENNKQDFAGWLRLVRAYNVLGRPEMAKQAIEKAREAFAGDEEKLNELQAEAIRLGLKS